MPRVGAAKYNALVAEYGDVYNAVSAMKLDNDFIDSVKREMDNAYSMGIEYISDDDIRYPQNLRNIKNHPIVLSASGNIDTLKKKSVSIVGTRHATMAGMNFISELAN